MNKFELLPPISDESNTKIIYAKDSTPLLEMVKIPAGEFLMGASTEDDEWATLYDTPQRCIYLKDYWISKEIVTNEAWRKFIIESGYEGGGHDYLRRWYGKKKPQKDKKRECVTYINYREALAFCEFYGLNLPSEAQWEKAMRGTDGRKYPWGDQKPTGVRYKGQSPYGVGDLYRNVREWCLDVWDENWLKNISNDNTVNTKITSEEGIEKRSYRLNWDLSPVVTSCTYRRGEFETYRVRTSFRVVQEI